MKSVVCQSAQVGFGGELASAVGGRWRGPGVRADAPDGQAVDAHGAEKHELFDARGFGSLGHLHRQHVVHGVVERNVLRRFLLVRDPRDQHHRVEGRKIKRPPRVSPQADRACFKTPGFAPEPIGDPAAQITAVPRDHHRFHRLPSVRLPA